MSSVSEEDLIALLVRAMGRECMTLPAQASVITWCKRLS